MTETEAKADPLLATASRAQVQLRDSLGRRLTAHERKFAPTPR